MNIFVLSWIIENCVKYHCDKHVVKMILETAQLLSTCQHVVNPIEAEKWVSEKQIYKKTHQNHPSSLWVRECRENYVWLCHFGLALCKEYAFRYDKQPSDHKCYAILKFLSSQIPPQLAPKGTITQFKMAMPDEYKTTDPIFSYRLYYLNEKSRMLVWRKRDPPKWVPPHLTKLHYESEIKRLKKMDSHDTKIEEMEKILLHLKN